MKHCIALMGLVIGALSVNAEIRIEKLDRDIYRVRMDRGGVFADSLLNRYGAIEKLSPEPVAALPDGCALPEMKQTETGFELAFRLADGERLYGLGDVLRDRLNRRGGRYELTVDANVAQMPLPMLVSSRGWGVLVNCSATSVWDCGQTDPARLVVTSALGEVDCYLFYGKGYRELLERYTRLAGRPHLPPAFALGLTFCANQWVDQYQAVEEVFRFRDKEVPCDVYSLEPGWMEYFYDSSTKKSFNKRFEIPQWELDEGCFGSCSWIGALSRMRMKLCLWLCMDYDLFVYEEACAEGKAVKGRRYVAPEDRSDSGFTDTRIGNADYSGMFAKVDDPAQQASLDAGIARRQMVRRPDRLTGRKQDGSEPWFDHLRKFVDVGVRGFKQDGAWQCSQFAKRKWAGKFSDDLVHNLYGYLNGKQVCEGYAYYRGLRPFVFSAAGYVGSQRYTLSWAGDTGGGPKPLLSALTLGCSGFPYQGCDTTVDDLASLHYGVFSPWMMQNNWDHHQQIWYRPKRDFEVIRDYVQLRYRLLPYIYTAAYRASQTGWPIMVPLALAYPEVEEYANVSTTYMFGPDLLVSAFADETIIPPGDWYDFDTGRKVTGPTKVPFAKGPAKRGGGLFVRAGAIIPMWRDAQYVEKGWSDSVELHLWPGDGEGELYEDDGDTLEYREGRGCLTKFAVKDGEFRVTDIRGEFTLMPKSGRQFKLIRHEVK